MLVEGAAQKDPGTIDQLAMWRRAVKFRKLSRAERRMLTRAALALVSAKLALKVVPVRAARALVVRSQALVRASAPPERIVRAVEMAGNVIPGARNCLVRALAAEAILRAAGHRCDLRIGVVRDSTREMAAHAWLDDGDGNVLIGDIALDRYRPLAAPDRLG